MEVARVQRVEHAAGQRVGQHELVGAHGVALDAQAEELRLHRVLLQRRVHLSGGEDRVQGFQHPLPGRGGIRGHVLVAVGHPEVDHGSLAQRLAEAFRDLAAALAVLDPEIPDALVRAGQREAALRLRVGEVGRVEVEAQALSHGPVQPVAELLQRVRVPIHRAAALFGVAGVQVELLPAGDELKRLVDVGAQLPCVPRAAGEVSGGGDAARRAAALALAARHVVALPAVH